VNFRKNKNSSKPQFWTAGSLKPERFGCTMRRIHKSQKGGSEREALLKRAYKRIADESVPFCERGGTTALVTDFCANKNRNGAKSVPTWH